MHSLRQVDADRRVEGHVEGSLPCVRRTSRTAPAVPRDRDDRQRDTALVEDRHVRTDQRVEVSGRQCREPVEMLLLPLAGAHPAVLADPVDPFAVGDGPDRRVTSCGTERGPLAMPTSSVPGAVRS